MTMAWHHERETAIRAVRLAARACQAVRDRLVTPGLPSCSAARDHGVIAKQDRSPVTVADFASQAIVSRVLSEAFPNDALVGEENSSHLREDNHTQARQLVVQHVSCEFNQTLSQEQVLAWIDHGAMKITRYDQRHWTIDPIDGTKGFLRGDQYAIALALIEGGQVVVGVLACPWLPVTADHDIAAARGVLLAAVRGQGVQQIPLWEYDCYQGVSVKLSQGDGRDANRFCESLESVHSNHVLSSQLAVRLGIHQPPLRMDSQAKYACVALGRAGIYLKFPPDVTRQENIWDHAAGSIVVEEAGGVVSDMAGVNLDFSQGRGLAVQRGIIACHAPWHPLVLQALSP